MTILSREPDGCGFFYGFTPGDHRRIDVTKQQGIYMTADEKFVGNRWVAFVDGDQIDGGWASKDEAEAAALAWMKANPET